MGASESHPSVVPSNGQNACQKLLDLQSYHQRSLQTRNRIIADIITHYLKNANSDSVICDALLTIARLSRKNDPTMFALFYSYVIGDYDYKVQHNAARSIGHAFTQSCTFATTMLLSYAGEKDCVIEAILHALRCIYKNTYNKEVYDWHISFGLRDAQFIYNDALSYILKHKSHASDDDDVLNILLTHVAPHYGLQNNMRAIRELCKPRYHGDQQVIDAIFKYFQHGTYTIFPNSEELAKIAVHLLKIVPDDKKLHYIEKMIWYCSSKETPNHLEVFQDRVLKPMGLEDRWTHFCVIANTAPWTIRGCQICFEKKSHLYDVCVVDNCHKAVCFECFFTMQNYHVCSFCQNDIRQ